MKRGLIIKYHPMDTNDQVVNLSVSTIYHVLENHIDMTSNLPNRILVYIKAHLNN